MSPTLDKMMEMLTCLCTAVRDDPDMPDLCFCGLMPGQLTIDDYIGLEGPCEDRNGQAWVRMTTAYNSKSFPAPSAELNQCGNTGSLSAVFEVGIRRAVAITDPDDEEGSPPSMSQILLATSLQVAEMELMRNVITCCFEGDKVLQNYIPYGPVGGVVGGSWLVSVLIED